MRFDSHILDLLRVATDLVNLLTSCLLYTSDAADERSSVDLGGRRIIKKKTEHNDIVCYVTMKYERYSVNNRANERIT